MNTDPHLTTILQTGVSAEQAVSDYRLCFLSREVSLLGRREVLTGKAKFGIFGDGKELPQLAMAHVFQPGDVRSGYYRDQTFAFATGLSTIQQFFAQLYANPSVDGEPHSGGRQMNSHFASRNLDEQGHWQDLTQIINSSPDGSPTASQMPRLVGLAQASKLFRELPDLASFTSFSHNGNEVAFGTIGNASCAEGHFWETINAIGVLQAPAVISIWDDDYGISVPNEYQITKTSLSEMLSGFQRTKTERGYNVYTVKAWDYADLIRVYTEATHLARTAHIPAIIHVTEVTQPQGHSTSGSHERYKTAERLAWEQAYDCLLKMREFILSKGYATEEQLEILEKAAKQEAKDKKNEAWRAFQAPIKVMVKEIISIAQQLRVAPALQRQITDLITGLQRDREPSRRTIMQMAHRLMVMTRQEAGESITALREWTANQREAGRQIYDSHLYSETALSPLKQVVVHPEYGNSPESLRGFEILNKAFDRMFEKHPTLVAFGEDVGQLGDVNQGMAGLQEKHGVLRISDTGIRETTIAGQAIGLAMRGLRPIAEIQYLDYLLYALQTLSDDLATVRYRTKGGQKAPVIIRTRGHRLEGIWHAGSPLGMMIHALRGVHIAVPRDMTRAVGMYHTLVAGDDPGIVVEVLNGYRLKEPVPDNLYDIQIPLGVPEVIRPGKDLTIVTYGACCKVALEAADELTQTGIDAEIIDVQTLLPFDTQGIIGQAIAKTNRVIFLDEDVPGGATAYMMQAVLEGQQAYYHLDSEPRTLTAKAHRPAYGDDGDYWSKPQVEDVFYAAYDLMHEADPAAFPRFY